MINLHSTTTIIAIIGALAGCPKRFEPAAAPLIKSPNIKANQQFNIARHLFEANALNRAHVAFNDFIKLYSSDPLVPLAAVFQGRIALKKGELQRAKEYLSEPTKRPVNDTIALQARYYLGLVEIRGESFASGYHLLSPYIKMVPKKNRPELLAALGYAARQLKYFPQAVEYLNELYELTPSPVEKLFARLNLAATINNIASPQKLTALYQAVSADSLVAVLAAEKIASIAKSADEIAKAQAMLNDTALARKEFGLPSRTLAQGKTNNYAIGLLIPFSGPYKVAGKKLLSGAAEAAHIFSKTHASRLGIQLIIRDSSVNPTNVARKLIEKDGVVALVGTLSSRSASNVTNVAAQYGVPFISLARIRSQTHTDNGPFMLLPDNNQRAIALAQISHTELTIRRVAIMAPSNRYGKFMTAAFTTAIQDLGGKIVAHLTYPPKTSSFTELASRLATYQFDGLFIPDKAKTLALIAPALAKAKLWSSANFKKALPEGRAIQLLATADGLSQHLVRSAGRYIQGAILSPGFFPDDSSPQSGQFVRQFSKNQGHMPSLLEALGFDGIFLVHSFIKQNVLGRGALSSALIRGRTTQGMTGLIRFNQNGSRADAPLLYHITGQQIIQK